MRNFATWLRKSMVLASLAGLFMLTPELAMAQGASNEALKNFAEIASTLVHVISAAALLLIQFFPPLWGSELITGWQVTEMLRPMWIYVRNVTNIVFVGVIILLALSNLVTSGKGIKEWNIKSKLGPVILGLIAVNFSMLAVRVLVDVAHVGTIALLSIADPVIDARGIDNVADYYSRKVDTENFEPCESGPNCKTIRELINGTFCTSEEACLFEIREIAEIQAQAELMTNPERKNIMLAFGTFFMKLESLPMLSADTGGLLDVLDSALFSLVFGVAYLLALVAMMIVLLVRVVMMWIFTIFSPILVTGWALGIDTGSLNKQFWQYLWVPVKAAAALAFGFVMISQLELMTVPPQFYVSVIEPGPSLRALWGPDEYGGWRMLWKILTVVLFWKAVFDFALKDLEGMDKIVGGIQGFGTALGGAALSAAGESVKLPFGTGESQMTVADLFGRGSNPNALLRNFSQTLQNPGSTSVRDAARQAVGQGQTQTQGLRELRNLNGSNPAEARAFAGRYTRQQLRAIWQEADEAERQRLIDALRVAFPNNGQLNSAGLTATISDADFDRILGNSGVEFGSGDREPSPTPAPAAAPGAVTVEGAQIQITNGDSPVEINAQTTSRDDAVASLRPMLGELGDRELGEILEALRTGNSANWADVTTAAQLRALLTED